MRCSALLSVLVLLALSEARFVRRIDLTPRVPIGLLLRNHRNPVASLAFCDGSPGHYTQRVISGGFLNYNEQLVGQVVGAGRVRPALQRLTLLRSLLGPNVLAPLSNYFVQTRLASSLPARLLVQPRLRLQPTIVQRELLRFLTRIDPALMQGIPGSVFTGIRSDLLRINSAFNVPSSVLPQLYNTYVSVISGNGRGAFLTGLQPDLRYREFGSTLGLYLNRNIGVLPSRLSNLPLFLQDFASEVDSRFVLRHGGLILGRQRVPDAADAFFAQLEHDHLNAVSQVLSDIYAVQTSIDLSTLPRLGYPGLLTNTFYPGFDPTQTDIVARYLASGQVGGPGLIGALSSLPYYPGLSNQLVPGILGSNLGNLLGSLKLPGLQPLLVPEVLKAALQPAPVTQVLLAGLNQGIVPHTPAHGIELYRLTLARMMLDNPRVPSILRLLGSPVGLFQTALRVTIPNIRPAIIRSGIPVFPLAGVPSLRQVILRRTVPVPQAVFVLVQRTPIRRVTVPSVVVRPAVVRPAPVVTPVAPVVTKPAFASITVAGVTIPGTYAQQIYTTFQQFIPGFTQPLLQPFLSLYAPALLPVTILRTPARLVEEVSTRLVPILKPVITSSLTVARVPGFITDRQFTVATARLAYSLETAVLVSRNYRVLPPEIITGVVPVTLRAFYASNRAFAPVPFLNFALNYYPTLVGGGQLVQPLNVGSVTLDPLRVRTILGGLRRIYGPFSYHGLGTILASDEAEKVLNGIDLKDTSAIIKALTFGQTGSPFALKPDVVKSINELLKPRLDQLFNPLYAVPDLQAAFGFGLNYMRVPQSLYGPSYLSLFRSSLDRVLKINTLVTNNYYNPLIIDREVDLLTDEIISGQLAPELKLNIPNGPLVLGPSQIVPFNTELKDAIGIRLMPAFAGQLITNYLTTRPSLQQVSPAQALPAFISYIRQAPFVRGFSFHLKNDEFTLVRQSLIKRHRLPSFVNTYPVRLQRYLFDSMYGSYALSTLGHFSGRPLTTPLTHATLFQSFQTSIAPSFFSQSISNIGGFYTAAPRFFKITRKYYSTLETNVVQQQVVHSQPSAKLVYVKHPGGFGGGYGGSFKGGLFG